MTDLIWCLSFIMCFLVIIRSVDRILSKLYDVPLPFYHKKISFKKKPETPQEKFIKDFCELGKLIKDKFEGRLK